MNSKLKRLALWTERHALALAVAAIVLAVTLVEWNIHIDRVAQFISHLIYKYP